MMEYVNLGRSGLKVSRIALGMMNFGNPQWRPWVLDETRSRPFVRRALDLGINFYDTADMYSQGDGEVVTGKVLLDYAPRDSVVIATKVFMPTGPGPNQRGLSRLHIMNAIDGSLKRLRTEYVDLYQIHRFDPETPMEETVEALHDVVKAGKALYLGASSMAAWQFARFLYVAERHGWTRFVSMQNYYNLVYREEEREMLPLCRAEGVGVIPFSPLARGLLAGSRPRDRQGSTIRARTDKRAEQYSSGEADYRVVDEVLAIASEQGLPPARIALAWLLDQPGVTAPIVGATGLQHLDDAAASIEVRLSDEERRRLDAVYQPRPLLEDLYNGAP